MEYMKYDFKLILIVSFIAAMIVIKLYSLDEEIKQKADQVIPKADQVIPKADQVIPKAGDILAKPLTVNEGIKLSQKYNNKAYKDRLNHAIRKINRSIEYYLVDDGYSETIFFHSKLTNNDIITVKRTFESQGWDVESEAFKNGSGRTVTFIVRTKE